MIIVAVEFNLDIVLVLSGRARTLALILSPIIKTEGPELTVDITLQVLDRK